MFDSKTTTFTGAQIDIIQIWVRNRNEEGWEVKDIVPIRDDVVVLHMTRPRSYHLFSSAKAFCLAMAYGLDPSVIWPTGKTGKIMVDDVKQYVARNKWTCPCHLSPMSGTGLMKRKWTP